jgi:hypothetical protein
MSLAAIDSALSPTSSGRALEADRARARRRSREDFLMRRRLSPERAAELRQWTVARAARFGYLAGLGCSTETILADDTVGAKSEQAVRSVATRWGLPLGSGGQRVVIPISPADQEMLEGPRCSSGARHGRAAATGVPRAPYRGHVPGRRQPPAPCARVVVMSGDIAPASRWPAPCARSQSRMAAAGYGLPRAGRVASAQRRLPAARAGRPNRVHRLANDCRRPAGREASASA